jgi:hypothetical protein
MRSSFVNYSQAYAETLNQQMLLNLARRANGHPVAFLQMGSINSTMSFGVNAGSNIGQSRTRGPSPGLPIADALTHAVTFGGNVGGFLTEQPSFSFTPLSGSAFAGALFNRADATIFFNLFAQGVSADLLMRVMVQSISFHEPDKTLTFVNVIDPERVANFRNFLTAADISRQLQKRHLLRAAPDQISFILSPRATEFMKELSAAQYYQLESDTLSIEGKSTTQTNGVSLTFRTFEGILSAVANESQLFDALAAKEGPSFFADIPPAQRRPVLRIQPSKAANKMSPPVVESVYLGKHYAIADAEVHEGELGLNSFETWNRDVFNILSELYVKISLDPNNLPVQQLIHVN